MLKKTVTSVEGWRLEKFKSRRQEFWGEDKFIYINILIYSWLYHNHYLQKRSQTAFLFRIRAVNQTGPRSLAPQGCTELEGTGILSCGHINNPIQEVASHTRPHFEMKYTMKHSEFGEHWSASNYAKTQSLTAHSLLSQHKTQDNLCGEDAEGSRRHTHTTFLCRSQQEWHEDKGKSISGQHLTPARIFITAHWGCKIKLETKISSMVCAQLGRKHFFKEITQLPFSQAWMIAKLLSSLLCSFLETLDFILVYCNNQGDLDQGVQKFVQKIKSQQNSVWRVIYGICRFLWKNACFSGAPSQHKEVCKQAFHELQKKGNTWPNTWLWACSSFPA